MTPLNAQMTFTKTRVFDVNASNSKVVCCCLMSEVQAAGSARCLKTKAKYTCPRCNIQYCSLECYKGEKHVQCSENFYKECFMEGLKDFGSSKEDKQNVLEMLQRVKDEDPGFDSDDDNEDLEARLEGLDLETDSKTVWNKLTDKEKKEFERLMAGGELSTLVEVWAPWWNDKVLISEMNDRKVKTRIPAIQKDITDISTLLSTYEDIHINLSNKLSKKKNSFMVMSSLYDNFANSSFDFKSRDESVKCYN